MHTHACVFTELCVCKGDLHLHACIFIEFNPILLLSKTLILGPGPFRPIKHLNTINSGVAKGSAHTYSPNTGPAEPRHCPLCTRLAFCWSSVVSWCAWWPQHSVMPYFVCVLCVWCMIVHVHVGVHVPNVGVQVGRNTRICSLLLTSVGSRNRTQVFRLAQSGLLSHLTGLPTLVFFFFFFQAGFMIHFCFVALAGFQLIGIYLPLYPKCWV